MPAPKIPDSELIGNEFNRLTVLEVLEERGRSGRVMVLCKCRCGKIVPIERHRIGSMESCGCKRIEVITIHGGSYSTTYASWRAMKERCTNSKRKEFQYYGARGIKVCDRWLNSFENFLSDMGHRPHGTSIDRKDNDGNYEPGNCRWATRDEQNSHNRRSLPLVTYNGETKSIKEWSIITGLSYGLIRGRIVSLKWSPERAFNQPVVSK